MSATNAKQKITQSIKDATNILVAVSADPSVDELSGALGLTIFLNALGKHATAVFSGKVPPAITFLEPDKTFEDTADSLRDFIIALNKDKADHLRYKLVDDAVKIFITPYRTKLTQDDLEFSQGDYNVELVLALNVENSEHFDKALSAHGKILHDADIMTITAGEVKSDLGSTEWHKDNASGVSEMLVELIDGLKTDKATLDEQMATALMTGIVAATERFSNDQTTSQAMTVAAELMAAGANQSLIVSKLEDSISRQQEQSESASDKDNSEDVPEKKVKTNKKTEQKESSQPDPDDGTLRINHEKTGTLEEVAKQTFAEHQEEAVRAAQARLDKLTTPEQNVIEPSVQVATEPQSQEIVPPQASFPEPVAVQSSPVIEAVQPLDERVEPLIGGTLNATTDQAAEDKRRELMRDQNKTILSHANSMPSQPSFGDSPLNAAMAVDSEEPPTVDPMSMPLEKDGNTPFARAEKVLQPLDQQSANPIVPQSGVIDSQAPSPFPPIAPLPNKQQNASVASSDGSLNDVSNIGALLQSAPAPQPNILNDIQSATDEKAAAMDAVQAALAAQPEPGQPAFPSAPPELNTEAASQSTAPTLAEIEANTTHGAGNGLPPLPPMPDFSTLPPLPTGQPPAEMPAQPAPQPEQQPFNPSQFQIPNQQ